MASPRFWLQVGFVKRWCLGHVSQLFLIWPCDAFLMMTCICFVLLPVTTETRVRLPPMM